jgi:tellurite resistance protein TerC
MEQASAGRWIVLGGVAVAALLVDQLVFHRRTGPIPLRRALIESASWIGLSLIFGVWVYWSLGPRSGIEFLTGYLIEKSLSLDNIFVFLLIFQSFRVPVEVQSKALYGGIVGALLLRAGFVIAAIKLLAAFQAFAYVLGAFLLLVGIKMLISGGRRGRPKRNWIVRAAQKIFPVTDRYDGGNFFLRENGRWNTTPLFLALIAIEAMDIVFAADSVPAVLAITRDTFVAYSSNVFAVLGLRALYFAVAGVFPRFRFLHQGLAAILIFVGLKMVLGESFPMSTLVSLAVIGGILAVAIAASALARSTNPNRPAA